MKTNIGGSYHVLTDKETQLIHETSLRILGEIGFEIEFSPLLDLLEEKGATVDKENQKAFLPPELISWCIKQAPGEFTFYGLQDGKQIHLGGEKVHFGTGGKGIYVMELDREKRPAHLQDVANFARLADKLEHIDYYIIPTHSHDVNINHLDVNDFYQSLKNTGKPVMGGIYDKKGLERVIELSSLLAGNIEKLRRKPFVGFITSIMSPLRLEKDRGEILFDVAKQGLPLVVSTAPIAGATAPITLAGTLALQNAEALMGVVLSQLVNPGTPVFYSAVPCTMDMRTGSFLMGSIESGLMNAAVSQMAHHYRLPSYITVGTTDSKIPDAQAAFESATNNMLAALAGGNFIHQAFGFLDGALTISYAKFVIDNDIVGSCMRALRGIDISEKTLAFDVIADVGPGGNFLGEKHTSEFMRKEMYTPRVSMRQDYQTWLKGGGKDSWEKAEEIARQILGEPKTSYISEEMQVKIESLFPELLQVVKAA